MKKLLAVLLCLVMIAGTVPFAAFADEDPTDADFYMTSSDNPTLAFDISSYKDSSGNYYLFLPDGVDASNCVISSNRSIGSASGATISGGKLYADASSELTVTINSSYTLTIMQGSIPSLNVDIDSGYSLDTIHSDKNEKIRATAEISGADDESHNLAPSPIEIKTRGNSTFWYMKKPYQIKFDSKTDLFGMGEAKKWILLANYVDGTMVRNKVVFDLGEKIGMPYTCESVFVDLYIDGEYYGVYQLCEKVEIGDSRVPLESDYGVVAEMESEERLGEEDPGLYFRTDVTGKPFVYKEYQADFEDTEDPVEIENTRLSKQYFESLVNQLEAELFNGGDNWALVESLIDVDSFINFYFIAELTNNCDATLASTYFYYDGPGDKLHCGPLWDYDRAFGHYGEESIYEQGTDADFLKNITDNVDGYRVEWFKMLFRYPEFVKRVNELYEENIRCAFDPVTVMNEIDALQSKLMPSLRMNHKLWVVFHTINDLSSDIIGEATTEEYIAYTTIAMQQYIAERYEHLEACYGYNIPTLYYTANNGRTYNAGCMTDAGSPITSLTLTLDDLPVEGGISYSYALGGAWYDAVTDGETLTTDSVMQGLKMELTGTLADYFDIEYRVYLNGAWSAWKSNGTLAGRKSGSTSSVYISRVQIRLLMTSEPTVGTVTFDTAGLIDIESTAVEIGSELSLSTVELEGYDFLGWYTTSDYSGEAITSLTVPAGNTTLYALILPSVKGDINGDRSVSISDLFLLKAVLLGTGEPSYRTNVDGEGVTAISDYFALKTLLLG